jgi:hypothetical protein
LTGDNDAVAVDGLAPLILVGVVAAGLLDELQAAVRSTSIHVNPITGGALSLLRIGDFLPLFFALLWRD